MPQRKLKIEILFPEVCNLYGDLGNIQYLRQCYSDAEFMETALTEKPVFADSEVDMIYMGSMTERIQEKVVERLRAYRQELLGCIEGGTVILFTGNAYELMGSHIEDDGRKIPCLGFFDYYAKRDMANRHFSIILAEFEGMEIIGFKDQFTMSYDNKESDSFMKIVKGEGWHAGAVYEGVRKNNFFGTYLLGPFLVMNPKFTKYLMGILSMDEVEEENNQEKKVPLCTLAFEEEIMAAYEKRLHEFKTKTVIK